MAAAAGARPQDGSWQFAKVPTSARDAATDSEESARGSPPRRRRRASDVPRLPLITASFAEIAEWGESSLDVEDVEAETRDRELQGKFMALVRDGLDLEWIASILANAPTREALLRKGEFGTRSVRSGPSSFLRKQQIVQLKKISVTTAGLVGVHQRAAMETERAAGDALQLKARQRDLGTFAAALVRGVAGVEGHGTEADIENMMGAMHSAPSSSESQTVGDDGTPLLKLSVRAGLRWRGRSRCWWQGQGQGRGVMALLLL